MATKAPMKAPVKAAAKPAMKSAAVPTPTKNMSVNIRQINNGYIVSKSGMKGDKYFSEEVFTPKMPKI